MRIYVTNYNLFKEEANKKIIGIVQTKRQQKVGKRKYLYLALIDRQLLLAIKLLKDYLILTQNNFLNFSIPVYDFSQGSNDPNFIIQPCQVIIPFELNVADKLPSSMRFFSTEYNQCQIKYSLIASIIPTEANLKPVQGIQEIFIGQQIPTLNLPNTTTSTQQPVVCCCCKSGQINYNITTNSRSFAPNESIQIKMAIDFSQYTKKVQSLNVELLGQVTMKADNNFREKKFKLYEKIMSVKVENSQQINQEVSIQVPGDITLSSQGQLLSVVYSLRIIPNINTC
ncbi:arrestin (macronuclear) [Tetrahymena thermophila SB210]|uniref:Arrestin n=1 Tax=Tetrahymena thermophila (strain SB210) TaxID=312017 RepID=Q23YG2_TETTS|nr:arrestin [Tetrahymena thermophila SB210]EAS01571.2 arrestin [Tetrahymena thermophila SB210]|eukprot:XP_001021816.2 arrestin [Tetrahymena thermophila SB210]